MAFSPPGPTSVKVSETDQPTHVSMLEQTIVTQETSAPDPAESVVLNRYVTWSPIARPGSKSHTHGRQRPGSLREKCQRGILKRDPPAQPSGDWRALRPVFHVDTAG